jgi:GTPase|tara:strand:+ start:1715 stop:2929 length:1215 start_codon:yes stop_codon:yes gene_type:complete
MGKHSTVEVKESAVLVGLILPTQNDDQIAEYLDELAFLVTTLGPKPKKQFVQRLDRPDIRTFVGKGKLQEIKAYIDENKIDVLVFDDDLSPSQLRNIEKELEVKIYDRSLLILDIFQQRARSAQAKTQVDLARYKYLMPRLTKMWTHLERQRGGTSTRGGAGEKEIETDRRMIRKKIRLLEEKLKQIDKQMGTQRKNRHALIRVALVGYTNVGKSTIMNLLSKADVFAENKLFATLDTTVRKVVVENIPFLLSDTVGFIRKLPHQLVESFKSTLDEVRESDMLIHVVDVSHPSFEDQIEVVNKTIKELESSELPTILVFNKIDQYTPMNEDEFDYTGNASHHVSVESLKKTWMANENVDVIFISAKKKTNLQEFRKLLYTRVKAVHAIRYPYNNFLYPDIPEAE